MTNAFKCTAICIPLLAAGSYAMAARVISDPFPVDATLYRQPTHCVWQQGTAAPVPVPVEQLTGGTVRCNIDISSLAIGPYTWSVWAKDASGVSDIVPFSFTVPGTVPKPGGLTIRP